MKRLIVGVLAACAAAVSAFGSMPPSPYVPVDWVQLRGNGTNPAKISTGIVIEETMKLEFKVSLDDTVNYGSAFKDYIDEGHNTTRIIRAETSGDTLLVCFHSKASGGTRVTALKNATDPIEGWMMKGQANINGITTAISTTQGTANDTPLCFQTKENSSMHFYYLRIFNNGEPLVEYVPCVNANDPTDCGIWNGTEVLKSATGTVTAGPAATLAMDVIAPQTFTGSPLTPEVTVRFYGRALEARVDYDVSYDNNTDPGEATVTVTGAGDYEGLNAQASFQITVENPFEVLDPQGASVGASAKFSEAFASCLAAGGGEIVLLAPATIDSRLAPAAADLGGKTVLIRSAEGRLYRLTAGTADAGFNLPEETANAKFNLHFKDIVLDGGAVWSSDEVTDLSNGGLTRTASFIDFNTYNYIRFKEGVVVENFHQGTSHYAIYGTGWYSYFYVDSADFVARRIRGGGFVNMGQNRQTYFRGTVTACYVTAPALMNHPGNYGGAAEYYDGTAIYGNVVKSGSHAVRLHADWPANGLKLGSTDAASKICICDNFIEGTQTRANINPCKATAVQLVGPLTEDSAIGISWPDSSPDGTPFATCSYTGETAPNVNRFVFDGNPVEGITYVGSLDGDNLSWVDAQKGGGIEQDEVFRVLNPGEEPQTFDRLEDAVAAVYSNAVIELTGDALYDKSFTVSSKQIVLRSAEGPRRVLKRVKGACITLQPTEMKATAVKIENLIVDGGAAWTDPGDFGSTACSGVKTADLFVTGYFPAGWQQDVYGILTLGAGATVRNVNAASAVLHPTSENYAGTIVMLAGSEIVDCRGECPIVGAFGNGGQIQLNGGVITRCLGSVVVQRNGVLQPAEIGAVTIVSNRVGTAALGQTSAGNNGYFKFTGGVTVIRDNFTAGNEEKNANFWVRPHFSGSLEAGSDIRLGVSAGLGGNIIVDINEGDVIGALDAKGIKGGCYIHNLVNPKLTAVRAAVDDEDCFVWGKASGLMLLFR